MYRPPFLCFVLLVVWARIAGAVLYCHNPTTPLPIPDDDSHGITDTIIVTDDIPISDLNIHLNISHTFISDLSILLTHVDTSVTVILMERPDIDPELCNHVDIAAVFDDFAEQDAGSQCAAIPPAITGTVKPFRPLNALAGQSMIGTWRLQVIDNASDDTGTLDSWCLEPLSGPTPTPNVPPSPTPTNLPGTYCDTLLGPALIPDNNPNGIANTITIPDTTIITDLNVQLAITHPFVGDLIATLTHVAGNTKPGDSNLDGRVTAADIPALLRILSGDQPENPGADANGDDKIDFLDVDATVSLIYRVPILIDRPGIPEMMVGCMGDDIMCILDDDAASPADMQCAETPPAIGGRVQPSTPLSIFNGQRAAGLWQLQVSDNFPFDIGTLDHWCLQVNTPASGP